MPYLSTCFINTSTPTSVKVIVDTLALERSTDIPYFQQPCQYLRTIQAECRHLRVQDIYFIYMHKHKNDYSPSTRNTAAALTVLVKEGQEIKDLTSALKWTIKDQLNGVKEV